MFKSIVYHSTDEWNHLATHELIDTRFKCLVSCDFRAGYTTTRFCAAALEYQRRNMPIAFNIALMYRSMFNKRFKAFPKADNDMLQDARLIDLYYPALQYGEKHYPCVIKRYKELQNNPFIKYLT